MANAALKQYTAACIASGTLFSIGMFMGWSSPVIKKLQQPDSSIQLTDAQISWMISLVYIGSITSPLVTGIIMDRFGRKSALYLTMIEAIISWMLLLTTNSATGIYVARFFGGMVSGSGITVAPIYLSEIAEPKLRGGINSMFSLLSYFGILFEYILGPCVSYFTLNLVSFICVLILTCLIFFIPETPYYYVMKHNKNGAVKSLAWLRAKNITNVESELNVIENAVTENMQNKKGVIDLFKSEGNRRALFLTESLAVIQRMSGISVIMAYASSAAPSSWVLSNDQCAILICLTWTVFNFLSTMILDRLGRRSLFIVSAIGCAVAQASYGAFEYIDVNTNIDLKPHSWFRFAALIVFSMFYPVGMGCVPSIIQGEVFPSNVKGIASGITSIVLAMSSFATNKSYQPIGATYGYYINYWLYSLVCVFGIIFAIFVLIETKGKTLQEIQNKLTKK